MVGARQSVGRASTTGLHIQFRQPTVKGALGGSHVHNLPDLGDDFDGHEIVHQIPNIEETRLG